jgi:hypothetical protein
MTPGTAAGKEALAGPRAAIPGAFTPEPLKELVRKAFPGWQELFPDWRSFRAALHAAEVLALCRSVLSEGAEDTQVGGRWHG